MAKATPITVYVELLGEGVEVWRPVSATPVRADVYRLHGPVPEDERWAFQPGEVVECRWRKLSEGEPCLVAVLKVDSEGLTESRLVELLRSALREPDLLPSVVRTFQTVVRERATIVQLSEREQTVLRDLAHDLEYFVADPVARAEDPSYYGPDRALDEIRSALADLGVGVERS